MNTCVNQFLFQALEVLTNCSSIEQPPPIKWQLNSLESYYLFKIQTLWGKCEQAIHYGIEVLYNYVAKTLPMKYQITAQMPWHVAKQGRSLVTLLSS